MLEQGEESKGHQTIGKQGLLLTVHESTLASSCSWAKADDLENVEM